MAQSRLRAGQALDIHDLVTELRRQRAGSVQSIDQYL
jgi:protein tyrosine phosphatase